MSKNKTCVWMYDKKNDGWGTECERWHYFPLDMVRSITDINYKYCPYCGGLICGLVSKNECPIEMELISDGGYGDGLGIPFNQQTQVLYYSEYPHRCANYFVKKPNNKFVKCKIVPFDNEQPQKGHTYLEVASEKSKNNLYMYRKHLAGRVFANITPSERGIDVREHYLFENWYKVVRDE